MQNIYWQKDALRNEVYSEGNRKVLWVMLTYSMKQAYGQSRRWDARVITTNHCFYLIHEGARALYVGKSLHPLIRLREHLRERWDGDTYRRSQIGDAILKNSPRSYNWMFFLFTLAECIPLLSLHIHPVFSQHLFNHSFEEKETLLSLVEQALIDEHEPYLNRLAATQDERYYKDRELLEAVYRLPPLSQEQSDEVASCLASRENCKHIALLYMEGQICTLFGDKPHLD